LISDWTKPKISLKPGAVPSVFCDCQEGDENCAPTDSIIFQDHGYEGRKRQALGNLNNVDEHCYSSTKTTTIRPKRPKKRVKTHFSHCLIVKNKDAISAALRPQIPLPEEEAVVPPQEIPTTPPQVEALVPIPESSDAPRHEAPDFQLQESPDVQLQVSSDIPLRQSAGVQQQEDAVGDLLVKLEAIARENAQLEKKVAQLENQLAAVKKQQEELKSAKEKFQKEAELSNNRPVEVSTEHERLSQWLNGKFSERQMKAAMDGITRGSKWDDKDVQTALRLKCAGGSAGLKAASELIMPLPSPRTVRRKIAHIKFEPGVQHAILDEFAAVVSECKQKKSMFADCLLFFDMSLKRAFNMTKALTTTSATSPCLELTVSLPKLKRTCLEALLETGEFLERTTWNLVRRTHKHRRRQFGICCTRGNRLD